MSSADDVLFGKIALNMHLITKDLLDKALAYQRAQAPQVPLGELLLQKGVLTRESIERVLEFQRRVKSTMTRPVPNVPENGSQGPGMLDSWQQYAPSQSSTTGSMAPWAQQYGQPMGGQPMSGVGMPLPPMPPQMNPAQMNPGQMNPGQMNPGQMNAGHSGFSGMAPGMNPGASHATAMQVAPGVNPYDPNAQGMMQTAAQDQDGLVGSQIGGCVIVAKIGEGGMGAIYRARHEALRKDVVVKILPPESAANPRTVERFFREARAAAKLEHPNIVQVLNVGTTETGLHFIIMQYIDGKNLEDVIQEKGRHPWKEATRIVIEIARGLHAAHQAGVIHRDIKADNILVTTQGVVKLADFGLAKDLNSDMKLTADGAMIGTPLYMAPEIGRVKEIDGRVDIYSLGVTYYYLLTGVQPFRQFPAIEILSAKAHDKLKAPEHIVPDLPEPVRNVLGKMLEKDRDARYTDIDTLLRDLEAIDRGFPVTAGVPSLWGAPGSTPATGPNASQKGKTSKRLQSTPSSKQKAMTPQPGDAGGGVSTKLIIGVVVAFAVVVALAVGAYLIWSHK